MTQRCAVSSRHSPGSRGITHSSCSSVAAARRRPSLQRYKSDERWASTVGSTCDTSMSAQSVASSSLLSSSLSPSPRKQSNDITHEAAIMCISVSSSSAADSSAQVWKEKIDEKSRASVLRLEGCSVPPCVPKAVQNDVCPEPHSDTVPRVVEHANVSKEMHCLAEMSSPRTRHATAGATTASGSPTAATRSSTASASPTRRRRSSAGDTTNATAETNAVAANMQPAPLLHLVSPAGGTALCTEVPLSTFNGKILTSAVATTVVDACTQSSPSKTLSQKSEGSDNSGDSASHHCGELNSSSALATSSCAWSEGQGSSDNTPHQAVTTHTRSDETLNSPKVEASLRQSREKRAVEIAATVITREEAGANEAPFAQGRVGSTALLTTSGYTPQDNKAAFLVAVTEGEGPPGCTNKGLGQLNHHYTEGECTGSLCSRSSRGGGSEEDISCKDQVPTTMEEVTAEARCQETQVDSSVHHNAQRKEGKDTQTLFSPPANVNLEKTPDNPQGDNNSPTTSADSSTANSIVATNSKTSKCRPLPVDERSGRLSDKLRAKFKREFNRSWVDINSAPSWPPIKKTKYLTSDWKIVDLRVGATQRQEKKKNRLFLNSLCYLFDGVYTQKSTLGRKAGLGLFCERPEGFRRGQIITEFVGWLVDREQAESYRKQRAASHIVAVQKGFLYIDGAKEPTYGMGGGSFANDGSEFLGGPGNNAHFYHWFDDELGRTRVFIRATADIRSGQEIFVPYERTYWVDNFEEQAENCPEPFRKKKLEQLHRKIRHVEELHKSRLASKQLASSSSTTATAASHRSRTTAKQKKEVTQRKDGGHKRSGWGEEINANKACSNSINLKRPLSAYMLFSKERRRELLLQHYHPADQQQCQTSQGSSTHNADPVSSSTSPHIKEQAPTSLEMPSKNQEIKEQHQQQTQQQRQQQRHKCPIKEDQGNTLPASEVGLMFPTRNTRAAAAARKTNTRCHTHTSEQAEGEVRTRSTSRKDCGDTMLQEKHQLGLPQTVVNQPHPKSVRINSNSVDTSVAVKARDAVFAVECVAADGSSNVVGMETTGNVAGFQIRRRRSSRLSRSTAIPPLFGEDVIIAASAADATTGSDTQAEAQEAAAATSTRVTRGSRGDMICAPTWEKTQNDVDAVCKCEKDGNEITETVNKKRSLSHRSFRATGKAVPSEAVEALAFEKSATWRNDACRARETGSTHVSGTLKASPVVSPEEGMWSAACSLSNDDKNLHEGKQRSRVAQRKEGAEEENVQSNDISKRDCKIQDVTAAATNPSLSGLALAGESLDKAAYEMKVTESERDILVEDACEKREVNVATPEKNEVRRSAVAGGEKKNAVLQHFALVIRRVASEWSSMPPRERRRWERLAAKQRERYLLARQKLFSQRTSARNDGKKQSTTSRPSTWKKLVSDKSKKVSKTHINKKRNISVAASDTATTSGGSAKEAPSTDLQKKTSHEERENLTVTKVDASSLKSLRSCATQSRAAAIESEGIGRRSNRGNITPHRSAVAMEQQQQVVDSSCSSRRSVEGSDAKQTELFTDAKTPSVMMVGQRCVLTRSAKRSARDAADCRAMIDNALSQQDTLKTEEEAHAKQIQNVRHPEQPQRSCNVQHNEEVSSCHSYNTVKTHPPMMRTRRRRQLVEAGAENQKTDPDSLSQQKEEMPFSSRSSLVRSLSSGSTTSSSSSSRNSSRGSRGQTTSHPSTGRHWQATKEGGKENFGLHASKRGTETSVEINTVCGLLRGEQSHADEGVDRQGLSMQSRKQQKTQAGGRKENFCAATTRQQQQQHQHRGRRQRPQPDEKQHSIIEEESVALYAEEQRAKGKRRRLWSSAPSCATRVAERCSELPA